MINMLNMETPSSQASWRAPLLEMAQSLWHCGFMTDDLPEDSLAPRATQRSLPMSLLRAREVVMSHFRPMLESYGVNEPQWRVIRVLGEAGALDASDVAERANILAPSLTRMIKSLTERGLIVKARDEGDGRRVMLAIAPAGRDLLRRVSPDSARIYAELEGRFGRERVDHLMDLLDALSNLKA